MKRMQLLGILMSFFLKKLLSHLTVKAHYKCSLSSKCWAAQEQIIAMISITTGMHYRQRGTACRGTSPAVSPLAGISMGVPTMPQGTQKCV